MHSPNSIKSKFSPNQILPLSFSDLIPHIATGSLQVEETSAYCTVNHRALASNYQLSNIKRPARDSNRRPPRFEVKTLTATPPSPRMLDFKQVLNFDYDDAN